jgi:hypothetical protein
MPDSVSSHSVRARLPAALVFATSAISRRSSWAATLFDMTTLPLSRYLRERSEGKS